MAWNEIGKIVEIIVDTPKVSDVVIVALALQPAAFEYLTSFSLTDLTQYQTTCTLTLPPFLYVCPQMRYNFEQFLSWALVAASSLVVVKLNCFTSIENLILIHRKHIGDYLFTCYCEFVTSYRSNQIIYCKCMEIRRSFASFSNIVFSSFFLIFSFFIFKNGKQK